MPARYANRTCTVCGLRRPQPYMRQVIRKVNTGHSGMSASINPSKGFGSASCSLEVIISRYRLLTISER